MGTAARNSVFFLNRLLYQSSGILLSKTSDKFLSKSKTIDSYSLMIDKCELTKNPETEASGG
jgi:hypothetical protein